MTLYNHAVSIAFEVISEHENGEDLTPAMLKKALLRRIAHLDASENGNEWLDAAGCPDNTFKEDPENLTQVAKDLLAPEPDADEQLVALRKLADWADLDKSPVMTTTALKNAAKIVRDLIAETEAASVDAFALRCHGLRFLHRNGLFPVLCVDADQVRAEMLNLPQHVGLKVTPEEMKEAFPDKKAIAACRLAYPQFTFQALQQQFLTQAAAHLSTMTYEESGLTKK